MHALCWRKWGHLPIMDPPGQFSFWHLQHGQAPTTRNEVILHNPADWIQYMYPLRVESRAIQLSSLCSALDGIRIFPDALRAPICGKKDTIRQPNTHLCTYILSIPYTPHFTKSLYAMLILWSTQRLPCFQVVESCPIDT